MQATKLICIHAVLMSFGKMLRARLFLKAPELGLKMVHLLLPLHKITLVLQTRYVRSAKLKKKNN